MIEKSIDALTEAIKANTEAILKLAAGGGAPTSVVNKPAKDTTEKSDKSKTGTTNTPPADTTVKITLADMRTIGLKAIEQGKQDEVKKIVDSYGVPAVTKIPEDKFAEAHAKLKALVS